MILENKCSECTHFDTYSNTCINRLNFKNEHFEDTLKDLIDTDEFSNMVFDKKISYYWEMSLNSFVRDLNIPKKQKSQLLKHINEFKNNIIAKTIDNCEATLKYFIYDKRKKHKSSTIKSPNNYCCEYFR